MMNTTAESLRAESGLSGKLLESLREHVGLQKFNAWFKHGTCLNIEADHVRLTVPNPFVANWIETHYQAELARAVGEHLPDQRRILITIDPSLSGDLRKRQLDSQADIVTRTAQGRVRLKATLPAVPLKHSLKDFVVGQCNKLAYSAAVAMASKSKAPFNPLFIHGHCGVGKTHLLQGLCKAMSRVHRNGRPMAWRYVTAEQFTNEFIASLRARKIDAFRARYRQLDLLAIDDVHFLSAKKATQDEFLHTFNTLETAGSKIVLASDAHPRLVRELNVQLVSRFVAGMVVKIDPPDRATRIEILRRRARAMKLHVGPEILEYIAMHIRGSVRELEGALIKLAALCALEGGQVAMPMVTEALADHLARTDSALTLGEIEATVASYFGITPADIHSSRRTRTVSLARMVAMFLARRHTQMSYPEIGRFTGKNHSSVVLAVQKMEQLLSKDGEVNWMSATGKKSMAARKVIDVLSEQFA